MNGRVLTAELPKLRLEPDLKAAVEKIAAKRDRPVSFVQRDALRQYVARETKKATSK